MKLVTFASVLGLIPLYLANAQSVTLWQFDGSEDPNATPSSVEGTEFLVPIGTSSAEAGAETTYIYNIIGTQVLTQASTTQTTVGTFVETVVASASGWRASELFIEQVGATVGIDCHLTASAAGECLVAGTVPFPTSTGVFSSELTATFTGAAIPYAVAVSAAASGSAGTSDGSAPGSQTTQGDNGALALRGNTGLFGCLVVVAGVVGGGLVVL